MSHLVALSTIMELGFELALLSPAAVPFGYQSGNHGLKILRVSDPRHHPYGWKRLVYGVQALCDVGRPQAELAGGVSA